MVCECMGVKRWFDLPKIYATQKKTQQLENKMEIIYIFILFSF